MPQQLVPISKRQAEAIDSITDTIKANQQQLSTVASVILLGHPVDFGQCGVVGTREDDGDHFLVVQIADIAPPAEVKSA